MAEQQAGALVAAQASAAASASAAAAAAAVVAPETRAAPNPHSLARAHLQELFREIEREFDLLYEENLILRQRLRIPESTPLVQRPASMDPQRFGKIKKKIKLGIPGPKKKPLWSEIRRYTGHRDGVCEVSCCPWENAIFATASADRTARLWHCVTAQSITYFGHKGSVNSIRFHPSERLVCTSSGDCTCHVFKAPTSLSDALRRTNKKKSFLRLAPPSWAPILQAGEKPAESPEEVDTEPLVLQSDVNVVDSIYNPLFELKGHTAAVLACEFLNGDKLVSDSWDNTLRLWSTSGDKISVATASVENGHLLNLTTHPTSPLVVATASDGCCRILDVRTPTNTGAHAFAETFQAHSGSCTTAVWSNETVYILTSGLDRTVKVWDTRNIKTPSSTFHSSVAINRFTTTPLGRLLVPKDEKSACIYDFVTGNTLAKVKAPFHAFSGRVSSVAWAQDRDESVVYTVGRFDNVVVMWGM
eukprot:TRINITY_DN12385_c1_g1_i4.p1 TRINITY_DN12385_c1_g1~~TRINITY_DN12385_c1_g1_i4.p1  ORF type:complete len:474 (+),score=130.55 TRINITY_DN12385_c1_g1_i4:27-1448(+)